MSTRKKTSAKTDKTDKTRENPDRAWKVAQLAATLATRYQLPIDPEDPSHRHLGPLFLREGEDSPDFDLFYLGLIARAETLLGMAEERIGKVYAYMLFEVGQHYSISDMAMIFKDCEWKGLTSDNSVRALVDDICEKLVYEIDKETEYVKKCDLMDKKLRCNQLRALRSEKRLLSKIVDKSGSATSIEAYELFLRAAINRILLSRISIDRCRLSENFVRFF